MSGDAEILTVGDELCRGEILDGNAQWLAEELWARSIVVAWMTSCRDDRGDLARALRAAAARADLVFVSGGLGPTTDDVTVDAIAEVLGVGIETHGPSLARLQERPTLAPTAARQVRVPAGATVFTNAHGLAPGFEVALGQARLFFMPGVPSELKPMFTDQIAPRVSARAGLARRRYHVFGKGESWIDHALAGMVEATPGASVHYQVDFPETLVKLVARDAAELQHLDQELRRRLAGLLVTEDDLAITLGRALLARGATLSVAESCTGGMVGALITDVGGSSAWFAGGYITYSNELKQKMLGVREETLRAHGAVSRETAEEMARGARAQAGTTHAVAITGIAGPGGGSVEKPVGTVHLAVCGPTGVIRHKQLGSPGSRAQIRRLAAFWALALVLEEISS